MNKCKALGVDQWSPARWRDISEEAIEELTKLLNHVEQKLTWPAHVYHNLIILIGKPMGGTLPIALMPMVYRPWTKIRGPQIDAWEGAWAGPWDAAVKGAELSRHYKTRGVHTSVKNKATYLGLGITGGAKRTMVTIRDRIKKTQPRRTKVS